MDVKCIIEGAHGVTLTDESSTVQNGGGKPGQGYVAVAIDFYNQTICADGSTQTVASVASTDKNKTGGYCYGVSFDINYGCPIIYEGARTLKIGTCPGYNNGVMIWRR